MTETILTFTAVADGDEFVNAVLQVLQGVCPTEHDRKAHESCMALTEGKPRRVIEINGQPYLERYYMGLQDTGNGEQCQWWLHRFLRGDSERHLHTHPWQGSSLMICGAYVEERAGNRFRLLRRGDANTILFDTLHRVVAAMPDTWTSLVVRPQRREKWEFVEDSGGRVVMRSAGEDWWQGCAPRPAGVTHVA